MHEAIVRVPVAGAAVFDEPLFVYYRTICDVSVVRDSNVFDEGEVVDAIRWVNGGGNDNRRDGG